MKPFNRSVYNIRKQVNDFKTFLSSFFRLSLCIAINNSVSNKLLSSFMICTSIMHF